MEDDSGYFRKAITTDHNVSRFSILNKLISELNTLRNCLRAGIVPKSKIKDHEKEIEDVEKCIDEERLHIKAVSEIIDANSEIRNPINHKHIRRKYKCIKHLYEFAEKVHCSSEYAELERLEPSDPLFNNKKDLPKNKPVKNDCDEELFIDGNSGWSRMIEGDDQ